MSAAPTSGQPIVSVGLPVYNGEEYIHLAIQSVLDQKFDDWELIISDNASTDDTESICRGFAEIDPRITYIRQPKNLGAGPNFKACFEPARGKYFCWLSADDLLGPEFLSKCSAVLDTTPDAVAAYSVAEFIGPKGEHKAVHDSRVSAVNRASTDLIERYREFLVGYPAVVIFSLMRRDLLATTPVMSSHVGGDRILVSEMGLHGRFVQIPEIQFHRRIHEDQYSWKATTAEARRVWFGGADAKGGPFTDFRRFRDHVESLHRVDMSARDRRRCWQVLVFDFGWHMVKSQTGLVARNIVNRIARLLGRDFDLYRWMQQRRGISHA